MRTNYKKIAALYELRAKNTNRSTAYELCFNSKAECYEVRAQQDKSNVLIQYFPDNNIVIKHQTPFGETITRTKGQ